MVQQRWLLLLWTSKEMRFENAVKQDAILQSIVNSCESISTCLSECGAHWIWPCLPDYAREVSLLQQLLKQIEKEMRILKKSKHNTVSSKDFWKEEHSESFKSGTKSGKAWAFSIPEWIVPRFSKKMERHSKGSIPNHWSNWQTDTFSDQEADSWQTLWLGCKTPWFQIFHPTWSWRIECLGRHTS